MLSNGSCRSMAFAVSHCAGSIWRNSEINSSKPASSSIVALRNHENPTGLRTLPANPMPQELGLQRPRIRSASGLVAPHSARIPAGKGDFARETLQNEYNYRPGTVRIEPHRPEDRQEPSGSQKVRVLEPPDRCCCWAQRDRSN